jgi:hypothetical protein
MGLMKELAELNAIYQKMSTPDVDEAMIVTNADKKGNTPAYQNYKKGMKKKDGTPMYKAADHMKEEEVIDEKMNAGLRAYLDKKMKGKKTDDKEENGNGKNGKASKGSKPDFLDLDKDGNKTEPMKSAAKSKKEETEYNYVNSYLSELSKKTMGSYIAKGAKDLADRRFDQGDSEKRKYDPDEADDKEDKKLDKREQGIARAAKKMSEGMSAPRMQKGAMAYDGPNKAASEAKDRVMAKTKAKRKGPKPTVTIDKPDSLVSMKVSKGYKESFDALIESGKFSDLELQRFLFDAFEEGYQRNPEKDPQNKPYKEKSRAERMADPERGINSPAFKKFMKDQGM